MSRTRGGWINALAGVVGGVMVILGVLGLSAGLNVVDTLVAVIGFLLAGWAALDHRRYRRGTQESELGGDRIID